MTVLPLRLNKALRAFAKWRLRVTETEKRLVNGRYQDAKLPERAIRAVVLAIGTERLEFLTGGDATLSGINVMTQDTLYFTGEKDEGAVFRQSFVHYKGQKYRVTVDGMTMGNTIFNSYDCLLCVERRDEQ